MSKDQQELANKLQKAHELVEVGAMYRHYKNLAKAAYTVLSLAIQEADESVCVVYQAEYGERLVFTRTLVSWLETVDVDGEPVPRFEKIS